jgi:pimeloyl-ACP methyl ester carboxylesterase
MQPQVQDVPLNRTWLRCWTYGRESNPALVISHGMALDSESFNALAQRVSADWRVVRWDMPGHGESGPMPAQVTMNMCVDALETVMTTVGVSRATLLGFSFGGMVSQLFAQRHPDRIDGLIAYGCLSPIYSKPMASWLRWVAEWSVTRGAWPNVRARFAHACAKDESVRVGLAPALDRLGPDAFRTMVRALLTASSYDPDFKVRAPVLWIKGESDSNNALLKAVESAFRKNHPAMHSVVIPGAGHCAHQDRPEPFIEAVVRFLDEIRPSLPRG